VLVPVDPLLLRVALGPRSYDLEIGTGNLSGLGKFLQARRPTQHAILICDEHVEQPHAARAAESLAESGCSVDLLVVPPGESTKSLDSFAALLEKLSALGAERSTVVVAVGGGVIGDLAGFVAASYARGLPFLQVPTTLLAQVDSSVGGKVGVNLPTAKNMVGAFWQPCGVVLDTETLDTLPAREYLSGLAEVVKYGVILDADFFALLEAKTAELLRRDPDVLRQVIARSCELKAQVVEQDEREETGVRAVLNYGHTFAHAFETLTHYETYLHGEAVAIGMDCAARLAVRLGRVEPEFAARQLQLLQALKLPTQAPALDPAAVLQVMKRDKKSQHGRLRFILPTQLGHVELVSDVPLEHVRDVLRID